ncbi:hypothetical protein BIW11_02216 [Tropilaelaps mercedesae]|uniref:Uncharacterized protein n=1 Tax=Tropilaelaps mercedesae TaxID=418985 RepID=A0A1V9X1R6_9ACAR|nr:hypothetical protein BIW11_02216 [Tropilaelaps mercedesae]
MLAYHLVTPYEDCKTSEEVHSEIEKKHTSIFASAKIMLKNNCQTWVVIGSILAIPITNRLGIRNDGMATLKQGPWFAPYDLEKIGSKDCDPPVCPCIRSRCRQCLVRKKQE